ncbi:MAG: quinolinate synthase subunit A [Armatimonadetes bacterium]|nr:MAG: quinolinate synthase subunit A [Armatimonadota bacterium]
MYQAPLPSEYQALSRDEIAARIRAAKAKLGDRVVILGHHYQRDEIVEHADSMGDSYKLCKDAQLRPEAEYIVFCGVHFMAESADILTDKVVILPNLAAGCSMADMANIMQVKSAWRQIQEVLGEPEFSESREFAVAASERQPSNPAAPSAAPPKSAVLPVTYINSAANLKAFVGERGGTVCTSTNAPGAVKWALAQSERVLFFPDQHLGRNTGVKLGFDPERDMCVWDPFKPLGGNTPEKIRSSKFLLWKGHCSVHMRFTVEQVAQAREQHPEIQVIVHPECTLDVVRQADFVGSTQYIIETILQSETGSTWAVGTEINLVSRLAKAMPDRTIFCLDPQVCPCSTMYRIHPSFLLWALENLAEGRVVNEVAVPSEVRANARLALDRMLDVSAQPVAD